MDMFDVIPYFLCVIGLGLLGYVFYCQMHLIEAKQWQAVEATVEKVALIVDKDIEGFSSYEVKVNYKYLFKQQEYMGDRIAFGYVESSGGSHEVIYNALNAARKIRIYVNPMKPTESIIIQGYTNSFILLVIATIMWNSFCITNMYSIISGQSSAKLNRWTTTVWILGFGFLIFGGGSLIDVAQKIAVLEVLKP